MKNDILIHNILNNKKLEYTKIMYSNFFFILHA